MLLAAKLRALLKRYWPEVASVEPTVAAGGMAVHRDGRAWALVDDTDPARGFARALLWALHRDVAEVHVLSEDSPALGAAARQGACFRTPVTVWGVSGAELAQVEVVPLPAEPPLDPRAQPFIPVIESAGAEAVIEWGTLSAEVLGLEVGRVCTDSDGAWLEVGIGKHDRLGHRLLWGNQASVEALSSVVDVAIEARRSGDLAHPLNQLARERWLRRCVLDCPDLIDALRLRPVAPPTPRRDLGVPLLAPVTGTDSEGGALLAACSVGFDPTFVPMAAELHAWRADQITSLVLVLPSRDLRPLIRRAIGDLRAGASLRTVPDDWHRQASRQ
jgi:hypothetical protein